MKRFESVSFLERYGISAKINGLGTSKNFNCNYEYIKYFNHHFNFCVSKSFNYSADDALL